MRSPKDREASGPGLSTPVSPTRSSGSQGSVTVVASAQSSPTNGGFTSTPCDEKPNVEEDRSRPAPGWPELVKLISETPDFEAFPAFTDLNLKSLLYYQAELTILRKELHAAEWEDKRTLPRDDDDDDGTVEPSDYAKRLDALFLSRSAKDPKSRKQWELIKQIRDVLKEYNEALLQYSQISALPKADDYNVESLRVWLMNVIGTDYSIQGEGAATWGELKTRPKNLKPLWLQLFLLLRSLIWSPRREKGKINSDLIVPRPGHKVDGLTLWVANEFVPFYENLKVEIHRFATKRRQKCLPLPNLGDLSNSASSSSNATSEKEEPATLNTYSEDRMLRFTSSVATVLACLLPTLAIAILAKLHSTGILLGVIAAFTAVFAIGLMFLTDAGISRVEIFTATAAFSAVMVVFVQNQNQAPSTGTRT